MIKITAAFPKVRQERVYDGMNKMHGVKEAQDTLNSWGVTLAPKMVQINARILAPPTVLLGGDKKIYPKEGDWRMDGKFSNPSALGSWSIAIFGDERDCTLEDVGEFVDLLKQCINKMGMPCYFPKDLRKLVVYQKRRGDYKSTLIEAKAAALAVGREGKIQSGNTREIDLVLCVIINRSDGLFG